jgi:mono/diheme cytochrome c family protein
MMSCSWISASAETSIERGEYLTNILGCGGCHTEGALLGNPTGQWLAGSRIGIAYTEDLDDISPGIVFPGNLTADKETGLGRWSKNEIKTFLLTGMDHYGKQATTVMPWPNYAYLSNQDLDDIAAFLKQLAPIEQAIPESVAAGEPVQNAFVRVGVYLFVPEDDTEESPNPPGDLND